MSEEISVAKVLDLKGLACPMPIVKVSKGIKEVEVGEVLQAVTSDPGALSDFPAWAKTSGNEIVKTETEGKETLFYIIQLSIPPSRTSALKKARMFVLPA
jgi:tRNA 2-thiouridine synthesizing protein A